MQKAQSELEKWYETQKWQRRNALCYPKKAPELSKLNETKNFQFAQK